MRRISSSPASLNVMDGPNILLGGGIDDEAFLNQGVRNWAQRSLSESFSDGGALSSPPNSPNSPAEGEGSSPSNRSVSQRKGAVWDRSMSPIPHREGDGGVSDFSVSRPDFSVSCPEEEDEQRPSWDRSVSPPWDRSVSYIIDEDAAALGVEQSPQWPDSGRERSCLGVELSPQWAQERSLASQYSDLSSCPSFTSRPATPLSWNSQLSNRSSTSRSISVGVAGRPPHIIDSTVVIRIEAHTFVVHEDVLMQSGILRSMVTEHNDDDFEIRCKEDPKLFAAFLGLLYENAGEMGQEEEEGEDTFPRRRLQHDLLGQCKTPEITNDNVAALLALSTKYEVPCLLEKCEDHLITNPTCPKRQDLARRYSMKRLNVSCMLDTLLSGPSDIESKIAGILNGSDEQHSDELMAELLFRMEEEKVTLESENCDLQQQHSQDILEHFQIT